MSYSPDEQKRIIEVAAQRGLLGSAQGFRSLEDVLESPRGYGLGNKLTPLQRAVCRVIEGEPLGELKGHPHVKAAIGNVSAVEGTRPKKVALCAGIRTFKSMVAAAVGIRAPQVVDTSPMLAGEGARFSVVSTTKQNARKVLSHALSLVHGKNKAEHMLAQEPAADSLTLRHREQREFTFSVVHGGRAGAGLVTDWSCGVVFDEAARMLSSNDGVINLDDGIDAVEGRLLPGAQMFLLSSPWAPFGTFYEWVTGHHLKPTPDLVVVWAEAPWLNPGWWTEERCAEMKRGNAEAYLTDVLAKFRTPEESIFSDAIVDPARRQGPWDLPPQRGYTYSAAMDPATRRNAWTVVIVTKDTKVRVAFAHQWIAQAGVPLRPKVVFGEIATALEPYGVNTVITDQWSIDALRDIALEAKTEKGRPWPIYLIEENLNAQQKNDAYGKIKTLLEEGHYELHPDPLLRDDLIRVKRRTTQNAVAIVLPITNDGRHCDFAPPLALASAPFLPEATKPEAEKGTEEYWKEREKLDIAAEIEQIDEQQGRQWWER